MMDFEELARDSGRALADSANHLPIPGWAEVSSRRRRPALAAAAVGVAAILLGAVALAGSIGERESAGPSTPVPTESTFEAVPTPPVEVDLLDGSHLEVIGSPGLELTGYFFFWDPPELDGTTRVYVTRSDDPAEVAAVESAEFESDIVEGSVQLWRGDGEGQPFFMSVDLGGWVTFLHVGWGEPPDVESLLSLADSLQGEVTDYGVILPNLELETFTAYLEMAGTENSMHVAVGECLGEVVPGAEIIEDPERGEVIRGDGYASWCDPANDVEVTVYGDSGFVFHKLAGLSLRRSPPDSSPIVLTTTTPVITSTEFDMAAFLEGKLQGSFAESASQVGVVVLVPASSNHSVEALVHELPELEGYTFVPPDAVRHAAEQFAAANGTDALGGVWAAFGLLPRFDDSPTSEWVEALQSVSEARVASVPFEIPDHDLPSRWRVVADLPFPIAGGAIVEAVDSGIVVLQDDSTHFIRLDGSWENADGPPVSVPDACCGAAAGFAIGDSLVLTDERTTATWIFHTPSLTWRQAQSRPESGYGVGTAVIEGDLWFVYASIPTGPTTSSVAVLDPATGQWRDIDPVPSPISVGDVTTDGQALVVVGTRHDENNRISGDRNPLAYRYLPDQGWSQLDSVPIDGQSSTVVWVEGAGLLAWDYYERESVLLDDSGSWIRAGQVPMEPSECSLRSVAVGSGAIGMCGGIAWFDGPTLTWQPIESAAETFYIVGDDALYGIVRGGRETSQLIEHALPPVGP